MSKGNVREYDPARGCGVITDIETGQQLTVYANYISLKKDEILREGQEVEYEIENNRYRNWAINVRIAIG